MNILKKFQIIDKNPCKILEEIVYDHKNYNILSMQNFQFKILINFLIFAKFNLIIYFK